VGDRSKIEWTDATWNCIRGCSRVSEGCRNCYAERVAARFSGPGQPYEGLARWAKPGDPRWTGKVEFIQEHLEDPLHWKFPRRIFVNSMSDLFHEQVEDIWIQSIFDTMSKCPQHIFQILTKRPERMRDWVNDWFEHWRGSIRPNVWLGVSVEDQETANERIPILLETEAPIRWVSYEPALGPVDFDSEEKDGLHVLGCGDPLCVKPECLGIDWIVCGGESGPGARPCNIEWFRKVLEQCTWSGTSVFIKQLGSNVGLLEDEKGWKYSLLSSKGGDMAEWPVDLKVREYPNC
jgi:protein gp37